VSGDRGDTRHRGESVGLYKPMGFEAYVQILSLLLRHCVFAKCKTKIINLVVGVKIKWDNIHKIDNTSI